MLIGCDFSGQNFTGASIKHCTFNASTFNNFRSEKSDIEGSLFLDCSLQKVSFRFSRLNFCSFSGSQIIECDFDATELKSSNFERVNGSSIRFSRSDLFAARFGGSKLVGSSFNDANLEQTDFGNAVLMDVSLQDANLKNGMWGGCSVEVALSNQQQQSLLEGPHLRNSSQDNNPLTQ